MCRRGPENSKMCDDWCEEQGKRGGGAKQNFISENVRMELEYLKSRMQWVVVRETTAGRSISQISVPAKGHLPFFGQKPNIRLRTGGRCERAAFSLCSS